jgi:RecA/RadA recombinase
VEVFGPESSGKTTLMYDILADVGAHESRTVDVVYPAGAGELLSELGTINEAIGFGQMSVSEGAEAFVDAAAQILDN